MSDLDKDTAAIVEQSILGDEEFNKLVMGVAKKALLTQINFLTNGTDAQKLAAARGFMPIFAKVLAREEQDINAQVYEKTREIMGNVIRRKRKVQDEE